MFTLHINPSVVKLYTFALDNGSELSDTGALISYSGDYTGRKPDWKRIVLDEHTQNIWWGEVNKPINISTFNKAKKIAYDKLFSKSHHKNTFCMNAYINWHPDYKRKIKLYTDNPYHALFFYNMTIPTDENFLIDEIDMCIYDSGDSQYIPDKTYKESGIVALNFTGKEFVILGTRYAGEIKKGLLTYMMYQMPLLNCLTLHSSANIGMSGDVSLFFGLSGTGKTTLSTESNRLMIGDDEHVWCPEGVFNIEGGCYAKCKDLNEDKEPEIINAIKFGSVLENVCFDAKNKVDFTNVSITQNTRCSYPLHFLKNVTIPAYTDTNPSNIILLCCDGFGLIPPVAKLNTKQAIYFFLNGYTTKIPGTEQSVIEPELVFSSCFGEAFIVHHPSRYGELLEQYIQQHKCNIWLLNTGWIQGNYNTGQRIPLKYSRTIVDSIHDESLTQGNFTTYPVFEFEIPTVCKDIPIDILNPLVYYKTKNLNTYMENLTNLHVLFETNYKQLISKSDQIREISSI